jgi:hypothetical protein
MHFINTMIVYLHFEINFVKINIEKSTDASRKLKKST